MTTASIAEGLAALESDRARASPTTSGSWRRRPISPASRIRCRCRTRCACARSATRRFAVQGTPTDCVIMGVQHVLQGQAARSRALRRQSRPERRRGRDLFRHDRRRHGGHAARHSVDRAQPGLRHRTGSDRARAGTAPRRHAPGIIRKLLEQGFAEGMLFNVNFPDCEPDEVTGIAVTVQGRRDQDAGGDRRAPGRPRQSLLLDRLPAPRSRRRSTGPICGRCPRSGSRSRRSKLDLTRCSRAEATFGGLRSDRDERGRRRADGRQGARQRRP